MLDRTDLNNKLLLSLDGADFDRLAAASTRVELALGKELYEAEDCVDTVWFPDTGLISVITTMLSGATIETSVIGNEGGLGFIEAAGGGIAFSRAVIQVPGSFIRVPARVYRAAFDESASLRKVVADHIELLVTELRQAMACIGLHKVEQRMAWWLLEAQDRLNGRADLPLTHEFLSAMLGVRRASVTEIALVLAGEGLIEYHRGSITIRDREGLKHRACECYATAMHFRGIIERAAA